MEKEIIINKFTKYEATRILGARALQISMDAPILLKLSKEDIKALLYDPLKIAEKELQEGILPISIHRPVTRKRKDKLQAVKEEKVSDEELLAKEQEVEKEIIENTAELELVEEESADLETQSSSEEQ